MSKIHPLSLRGIYLRNKVTIQILSGVVICVLTAWGFIWNANPTHHPELLKRIDEAIGGSCDDPKDKNRQLIEIKYDIVQDKYFVVCGDYDSNSRVWTNIETEGGWEVRLK